MPSHTSDTTRRLEQERLFSSRRTLSTQFVLNPMMRVSILTEDIPVDSIGHAFRGMADQILTCIWSLICSSTSHKAQEGVADCRIKFSST